MSQKNRNNIFLAHLKLQALSTVEKVPIDMPALFQLLLKAADGR